MKRYRLTHTASLLSWAGLWLGFCVTPMALAQAPADSDTVIRTETRVVLVDAVVTDRKGDYIHDLTAKDFKLWEDNDEQTINSFSIESGADQKHPDHYMVLFFDTQAMSVSDQMQARIAAGKFIDSDAGPHHYIAVVNYTGALLVPQNFTTDAAKLRTAATQLKLPIGGIPSGSGGAADSALSSAESDFTLRSGLDAIRSVARGLAALPGRKTFVLLTSGYLVSPENMSVVTAVINECNKANVALYPVDVRGLVADLLPGFTPETPFRRLPMNAFIQNAAFTPSGTPARNTPQQKGGGGTGGGGHSGAPIGGGGNTHTPAPTAPSPGRGNTGGHTGGGGGNINNNALNNARNLYNQSRLLPPILPNVSGLQQVLYQLASGTGGFVILNTNDLLGGMQKIAKDQNEYYLLGYTPNNSEEGKCHAIKVKVDRSGASVRARTGYCDVPPQDLLSGNAIEKDLEKRVSEPPSGPAAGSMQAPFFYTAPNRARVNFAMDIPATDVKAVKVKGKLHAELNILCLALGPDGKAAARFSDTMKFDFADKKEFEEFKEHPIHYGNQFRIAPGQYKLNVAFESGRNFGKLELPLKVDAWDGNRFSMSDLALSTETHRVSDISAVMDAELLADRTPLVAQGAEITPAGSMHLKKAGIGVLYAEIYEPLMRGETPPKMGVQFKVLDRKTGESKFDSGLFAPPLPQGAASKSPVVPIGLRIPIEKLAPGIYRIELKAVDSGGSSTSRSAEFDVE